VDGAVAAEAGPATTTGWTLSVATTDLDTTLAAVTAAGGSVLSGPADVDGAGRSAVVADPTGAVVGLREARTRIGASWVNAPGGLTWENLRSSDPAVSRGFYAAVFRSGLGARVAGALRRARRRRRGAGRAGGGR
jgi:predicted enzyme related to lactoylglutathione lyase